MTGEISVLIYQNILNCYQESHQHLFIVYKHLTDISGNCTKPKSRIVESLQPGDLGYSVTIRNDRVKYPENSIPLHCV